MSVGTYPLFYETDGQARPSESLSAPIPSTIQVFPAVRQKRPMPGCPWCNVRKLSKNGENDNSNLTILQPL